MDLEKLNSNKNDLLNFMKNTGYSTDYTNNVRIEINRIINKSKQMGWNSYNDVYQDYVKKSASKHYLKNKRVFLGLIENFVIHDRYPNRQIQKPLVRRDSYYILNDEFKELIDYYCITERKRGKKETVIYGESHNAATFLRNLQEKGINRLDEITEEAVLFVFISPEGSLIRSCSYKKNIAAVFKACVSKDPETFNKILSFLPQLRETRKTIQYLTLDEVTSIKHALLDETSTLSLRDRAIGIMAMYTGLRISDIVGITKDSIDWNKDLISISQQKTDVPLELPLSTVVGNAIFDYIEAERPDNDCEHIFVSKHVPDKRLKNRSLSRVSNNIMAAANVRQKQGDRRGFHIFRHRLATALLENDVARPVVSSILGHASPESLDTYLSADFKHLKECALSIENFVVDEGVFSCE